MFITNEKENVNTLLSYLERKLPYCNELKILVGYFYFGGIAELLNAIKNNPDLKIKVLIGLDADIVNANIIEYHHHSNDNKLLVKKRYFESLKKVFNHQDFDNQEFYSNVAFYLELLESGRLEIRKARHPNHSKLYIFNVKDTHSSLIEGFFVTGSSNLTRSGLREQYEFNVSIKDYGLNETIQYFDKLWNNAVRFEKEDVQSIIQIIRENTLIKEITPFEAYCYVLKTYLDSFKKKELSHNIQEIMKLNDYYPYQYQLDAIGQALAILEKHNGVIIADVVGLGKSVIASAVAYELKERGLVIAPPGLVGTDDKTTGWKKYLEDFGLAKLGWEAYSLGKLEEVKNIVSKVKDYKVVIIDEAHRFRNQSTQSYDLLKEICRNKKVILLTATPFNNHPSDIFSLLKLFVIPKKSDITFDTNLEGQFRSYGYQYNELLFIKKNIHSKDDKKKNKALKKYHSFFPNEKSDEISVIIKDVNRQLKKISNEIKNVLIPIMIRRNRIDLLKHPLYKNDLKNLSTVQDPQPIYFELSNKQSEFYDWIINKCFIEDGLFTGAIYMPFHYYIQQQDISEFDELFQTNLFGLMRRLLVKRFESSFGAFYETTSKDYNSTTIKESDTDLSFGTAINSRVGAKVKADDKLSAVVELGLGSNESPTAASYD